MSGIRGWVRVRGWISSGKGFKHLYIREDGKRRGLWLQLFTFDSICTNFMVGGYTEDLINQQNCQNWAVGACVGMGACPGQYGIYIVPNVQSNVCK